MIEFFHLAETWLHVASVSRASSPKSSHALGGKERGKSHQDRPVTWLLGSHPSAIRQCSHHQMLLRGARRGDPEQLLAAAAHQSCRVAIADFAGRRAIQGPARSLHLRLAKPRVKVTVPRSPRHPAPNKDFQVSFTSWTK